MAHHHPACVGRQRLVRVACVGVMMHAATSLYPFTTAFTSTATPCAVHAKLFPSPSFGRATSPAGRRLPQGEKTTRTTATSAGSGASKEAENLQDQDRETLLQKSEMLLEGIHELEASLKNLNREAIHHAVAATTTTTSPTENTVGPHAQSSTSTTTTTKNTATTPTTPTIKTKETKAIQMDRAAFRLDGLEVYAVVSALTLATSIQFFDILSQTWTWESTLRDVSTLLAAISSSGSFRSAMQTLFTSSTPLMKLCADILCLIASATGMIGGLHATLVFSLMTVYGRTAMGMGWDAACSKFFQTTDKNRFRGFRSFRLALTTFSVQIVFMICARVPIATRKLCFPLLTWVLWRVHQETQCIIDSAATIIFAASSKCSSTDEDDDNSNGTGISKTLSKWRRLIASEFQEAAPAPQIQQLSSQTTTQQQSPVKPSSSIRILGNTDDTGNSQRNTLQP